VTSTTDRSAGVAFHGEPSIQRTGGLARDGRYLEVAIAGAFALAVLLLHPVGAMFARPYWLDEAWVADLARAPLSRQMTLSSSTSIGWVLLLRLVPGHAAQRYRAVPLAFSAATGSLAYVLVRRLNWRSTFEARWAGVACGAAVVLAPVSLLPSDLKQYSADAAISLLLLLLCSRTERDDKRRSLIEFGAATVLATPFSTVAMFVAVAAFAGLLGSAAIRENWRRVRDVLMCGAASGALILTYFAAVVLPHDNQALREFWHAQYLTGSPVHMISVAWHRILNLQSSVGVPPLVMVFFFAFALGVLCLRGHVAIAISAVVLWAEMFLLGAASRYPFLDIRTSTFLLTVSVLVACVGFTWFVFSIVRRRRALIVVAVLASVASLVFVVRHDIRNYRFSYEDTRGQARYVAAHRQAHDVVVVNEGDNWGFAYYWPGQERKSYVLNSAVTTGFVMRIEGINAYYVPSRRASDVLSTMRSAVSAWRALGGDGRIWVARSHAPRAEGKAWSEAFSALNLQPVAVTSSPEPLIVVDPRGPLHP